MHTNASKKRILILGGGFGGVYTARDLERLCAHRSDVENQDASLRCRGVQVPVPFWQQTFDATGRHTGPSV